MHENLLLILGIHVKAQCGGVCTPVITALRATMAMELAGHRLPSMDKLYTSERPCLRTRMGGVPEE